ncbi:cytochrome d ubiquinol oxidase subunit II [Candidatus Berkiella cookevillensis]|uniref:Cytochrome d ubiquinol oxidase subunit II n=1 Tax=Candidatus Berkiella cookevillensis TaxID=437022 RepID=A0AAE3L5I2_9GAMM|nr:cytochrome d ubiquinol oxidase subunit II [Candidatus Berkiella cookevillensis]
MLKHLPLIWGGLIVFAIFLYVLLDGFDIGIGILFPFAPEDTCRSKMMNSIAPFWDGNETWLILGGGGLLAAFPLAYAILASALYLPIIFMLVALIFRGLAFEFRFKASLKSRAIWDYSFHFGSLFAAFCQGIILGAIIQGISVEGRSFSGGAFDWLTAFSLMTGLAMIVGYSLLGCTWLILKTDGITQAWARKTTLYILAYFIFFMAVVSLWTPYLNFHLYERWYTWPNILYLSPIPLALGICFIAFIRSIKNNSERMPFFLTILMFMLNFAGLVVGLWPWIVPYQISFAKAAAAPESQLFLISGAIFILPIILGYTAYSYYVFRGKVSHEQMY